MEKDKKFKTKKPKAYFKGLIQIADNIDILNKVFFYDAFLKYLSIVNKLQIYACW